MTAIEEREAEWHRHVAEFRRACASAPDRARQLLAVCLGPEQYASYTQERHFTVTASSGQQWEIWDNGMSGNVVRLPASGHDYYRRYCIHPRIQEFHGMSYYGPDADAHLAQALALAADEARFLRVAHLMERTGYHPFNRWKVPHD